VPISFDSGPRLRVEEFRLLRELINRHCGISFGDDALQTVERRLRERLQLVGTNEFSQYYHYLRYHPDGAAEIERAVDILTTNETYFFREDYQLRAFREEILPNIKANLKARNSKQLSIWSAGCSTGEEVYTLAILIVESGLFEGYEVRIFGNDISRRVLQTARKATYRQSSFRVMDDRYQDYFIETPEGRQVKPAIRAMCHFGFLNLLDKGRSAIVGRVDAIFCRNVLIYFDQQSRRQVIESFHERLWSGGYLMLGHSESLLHLSTAFELVHLSSDLVYRKPVPGEVRTGVRM
jgi:chemotaxis protein methyltransferase CheR